MKTLEFPEQVSYQILHEDPSTIKFTLPENVEFRVYEKPSVTGSLKERKLIVKSELTNQGKAFDLIVNPYGGEFPYGGTSHFVGTFSSSAQGVVEYSGPAFPPEAPLPMKIMVPSNCRIIFSAEIPLKYYDWKGTPEISIDWQFFYFEGPSPKGTLPFVLPEK